MLQVCVLSSPRRHLATTCLLSSRQPTQCRIRSVLITVSLQELRHACEGNTVMSPACNDTAPPCRAP